jgi:GntR family transcriptional regulator, transcriptional repressor for pyruvate dehydrogenase complex
MIPSTISGSKRGVRLSDQVVSQLQTMIKQRAFAPGERIPSERELCETLGVSRTVVREAVGTLVAKGLLEVRPGGGTAVRHPDPAIAMQLVTAALISSGGEVGFEHLQEVRALLEVEIAGLAAVRRTAPELAGIRAQLEATQEFEGDPQRWAEADVAFHAAIAEATHNPLYPILLGSISGLLMEVRLTGIRLTGTPQRAFKHHINILAALEAGKGVDARKAMQAHLRESRATFTKARMVAVGSRL